eukprot:11293608-Ditylum_brightwellii.AAC.1
MHMGDVWYVVDLKMDDRDLTGLDVETNDQEAEGGVCANGAGIAVLTGLEQEKEGDEEQVEVILPFAVIAVKVHP